jgi:hypothetical protein
VRAVALQLDVQGNAIEQTGDAQGFYRLNLPVTLLTAKTTSCCHIRGYNVYLTVVIDNLEIYVAKKHTYI